ncbi:MAG: FMN-binding protein, partial [Clostridia bacterium]|nr:FMN-binding protein [Clostridia bacterium]
MRKSLSLLIALALVLAFCICAHAESAYKPGTYTASAQGFGGTVTVTIEIGGEGILSVVCEGENETSGIGGEAMPKLADAVLEAQGADIDGITGATLTSGAVISAVNECLAEAMGETVEIPAVKMLPGTYT